MTIYKNIVEIKRRAKNEYKQRMFRKKILCHITKLVCLTEFGEIKELNKLVDIATSTSAKLLALDECSNESEE